MFKFDSQHLLKIWGVPVLLFLAWGGFIVLLNPYLKKSCGLKYTDFINLSLIGLALVIMFWVILYRYRKMTGTFRKGTLWGLIVFTILSCIGWVCNFYLLIRS